MPLMVLFLPTGLHSLGLRGHFRAAHDHSDVRLQQHRVEDVAAHLAGQCGCIKGPATAHGQTKGLHIARSRAIFCDPGLHIARFRAIFYDPGLYIARSRAIFCDSGLHIARSRAIFYDPGLHIARSRAISYDPDLHIARP
ncbi:hypothetical protein AVEN_132037-1 [Araneus ventricosus]|uniref:Uncharacterized protein n=1 Tax=Araneus ventricosus TaxID=182803 RepID=A0A4Y2NEM3_ARAVE|nr:hypothetical protein AVEN_132037-1 [Araneus ventricosus]